MSIAPKLIFKIANLAFGDVLSLSRLSQSLAVPSSSSGKEIHSLLFPDCCIALWVSSEQIMLFFLCVCVFFPLDLASCLGGKKNVFILMSKSDFLTSLLVSTAAPWKLLRAWFPSSEKNKIFFYHMSNCTLNGFKNSHVVQKSLSLIAPFLRFNEPFRNYVCCWLDVCAAADFLSFFFARGCERRATLEVVRFFFNWMMKLRWGKNK